MANNELSGPCVTTYIANWLSKRPNNKFTYRIVFIPETIGSITYLSRHYKEMKRNIIAGFNVTCVGDDRVFSYLPSRNGNTISDKIAIRVLSRNKKGFKTYSWLDRGSDERQYCSPNLDLPIASIMRSKYSCYKEYHNSLDKIGKVVTEKGLQGSFKVYKEVIKLFEKNYRPIAVNLGEPFLKKHGLFKSKAYTNDVRLVSDILTYCDGDNDLNDIADKCKVDFKKIFSIINKLKKKKLII